MTEYLKRLANRIIGLPPPFRLSCFISDLIPEIHREVQALQPLSLPQATTLTWLQEDKLNDQRKGSRPLFSPNLQPTPTSISQNPNPKPKPTFTQHTPEEMAFWRKKGLGYNCDEK